MRQIIEDHNLPAPTGVMPGDEPQQPQLNSDGEEQASPEEQQFYDQFMAKALTFIHGPKSSRAVLQHLNQKDLSVPEAVGRTTAFIVKQISGSAKAAKAQVYPDAMFSASQEIVEDLLQTGSAAKIFPIDWPQDDKSELSPEQSDLAGQAVSLAAHYYGKEFVQTEEGKALQPKAQDAYLSGIANEADQGSLDPDFEASLGKTTVRDGVKRALIRQVQ